MLARQKSGGHQQGQTASQRNAPVKQLITRLRTRLARLASQQEEVAESREQILVDRGNLVRSGKHVQSQRDRTANAEVALMNVLRQHYNNIGAAFPVEIDAAYSKVDEERTKLGLLEAEHTELDQTLGAHEWTFMDLENDLYQYDLQELLSDERADDAEVTSESQDGQVIVPGNPIPPSARVQYQVETKEYSRLKIWFRDLRNAVAKLFDAATLSIDEADLINIDASKAVRSFDHVLTQLTRCEVRLQHLQSERLQQVDIQPSKLRQASEPVQYTRSSSATSASISKAYSEGAISRHTDQIPVMHRVRDWLLDCLKQNAVDKMQYASILQAKLDRIDDADVEFADWEVLAAQQWPFDTIVPKPATEAAAIIVSPSYSQTSPNDGSNNAYDLREQMSEAQYAVLPIQQLELVSDTQLLGDLAIDTKDPTPMDRSTSSPACKLGQDFNPHATCSESPLAPAEHVTSQETNPQLDATSVCGCSNSGVHSTITRAIGALTSARCDSVHSSAAAEALRSTSPHTSAMVQQEGNSYMPVKHNSLEEEDANNDQAHSEFLCASEPELVYSQWEWSSDLQRYYVFGFAEDDNIAEAVWLEPAQCLILGLEDHTASNSSGNHSNGIASLAGPQKDSITNILETPTRCPFINFCHKYIGHFDSRYSYVGRSEQPHFYVTGRVFSTLRLHAIERPTTNLMRPRTGSWPVRYVDQQCHQLCFVVVYNKDSYSRCLRIQSSEKPGSLTLGSVSDWGIIYTSDRPPKPQSWEQFDKKPLRVQPKLNASLSEDSRVYYGGMFRIEHSFPVLEIGVVVGYDIERLLLQYMDVEDASCAGRKNTLSSIPVV